MSSIASSLHLKICWKQPQGKQIPPTHYGPNIYKADQHNVSTVALMFTTFINWAVSDSLFGSCLKKTNIVQQKKQMRNFHLYENGALSQQDFNFSIYSLPEVQ